MTVSLNDLNEAPVIDQTGPLGVTMSEDGSPTAFAAPVISATNIAGDTLQVTDQGGLSDSTDVLVNLNDISETEALVRIVSRSSNPPIPAGQKVTCQVSPGSNTSSPTCPVVVFNGIVYWAYSYLDNRSSLNIVGYNSAGNVVQQTNKDGIRYINEISVNNATNTVLFTGQERVIGGPGATTTMTYSSDFPFLIP